MEREAGSRPDVEWYKYAKLIGLLGFHQTAVSIFLSFLLLISDAMTAQTKEELLAAALEEQKINVISLSFFHAFFFL